MKNNYYFLYYFFDNLIIRWVRVAIFLGVGVFVYLNIGDYEFIVRLLPIYFVLILQEFFIHFKLENSKPLKKATEDLKHPIECVDYKTRVLLERSSNMENVIREMGRMGDVNLFNSLLEFKYERSDEKINEEELLKKSLEVVLQVGGAHIHAIDIYASYMLLLDQKNRILFNSNIFEEDVLAVLSWVRKQYLLDSTMHNDLRFSGSGIFDFFVFGWSGQLARYATNFTSEVLSGNRATPIGRNEEYDLLITSLTKNSSSNALLIGRAGVGKATLITQFVLDSDQGNLPHSISNKIVFKLYPERLLSGVSTIGDLEERFVELFSELSHAGNIIVYIPNIENIFGGGGLDMDISGSLVEYLQSSNIKIIGSTTAEAFQRHIYNKHEIKELFDVIDVKEPDDNSAVVMVLEKSKELSNINKVKISYSAVKEACLLSASYTNDGSGMPGRAIRLLEDVIANTAIHGVKLIKGEHVKAFIQEKTHIVLSNPSPEESDKLLHLEDEIHKRIISQKEAVKAISDAMRRVRSGIKDENKPIASFLFLGPTGVGKTETAKALAKVYFGDEKAMIRLDMSEYQNPDSIDRFLGKEGSTYENTLSEKVIKNPFSLILLDEFEKTYRPILDLFLQILDEGRLTDNLGRTVSFSNTIIIATSNAGSEFIRENYREGIDSEEFKKQLIEKVLQLNIFKPELVNRFDDVVAFKHLSEVEVASVAKIFLEELKHGISKKQIILQYQPEVAEYIARSAYSAEFGARNISRFIEQSVENQLSKLILSKELDSGGTATILVENDSLVIKV